MTEPGTAGGRGYLRASHADREQSVEVLKSAFVQGRLTKDELDARVGQALASRTHAELAALTADIPAEPVASPSRQPVTARPRHTENATLAKGARVITAATVVTAAIWVCVLASDNAALGVLLAACTFTWLGIVLLVGAVMLDARLQKRSGGQLPPRRTPGAGGPAPRRAAPAAGAGELPPIDEAPRATAETASRRASRPRYCLGCAAGALSRSRYLRVAGQLR